MIPSPAQYLLRFDDLCPTVFRPRWQRFLPLIEEFELGCLQVAAAPKQRSSIFAQARRNQHARAVAEDKKRRRLLSFLTPTASGRTPRLAAKYEAKEPVLDQAAVMRAVDAYFLPKAQ